MWVGVCSMMALMNWSIRLVTAGKFCSITDSSEVKCLALVKRIGGSVPRLIPKTRTCKNLMPGHRHVPQVPGWKPQKAHVPISAFFFKGSPIWKTLVKCNHHHGEIETNKIKLCETVNMFLTSKYRFFFKIQNLEYMVKLNYIFLKLSSCMKEGSVCWPVLWNSRKIWFNLTDI